MAQKLELEGDEEISWGGDCQIVEVFTTEIRDKNTSRNKWEENIKDTTMGGDYDRAFTD